jgi:serine/threonine protein kinase
MSLGQGTMVWREYTSTIANVTTAAKHADRSNSTSVPSLATTTNPGLLGIAALGRLEEDVQLLHRLLDPLLELTHPHILRFHGCSSVQGGTAGFVMLFERPTHGTLREVLDRGDVLTTASQKGTIALQIALGLEYLHANEYGAASVITSSAVFVDAKLSAQICVTGEVLAAMVGAASAAASTTTPTNTHELTVTEDLLRWAAPEQVRVLVHANPSVPNHGINAGSSHSAGVWTFGVLLWEVFAPNGGSESTPYGAFNVEQLHAVAVTPAGRPAMVPHTTFPEVCLSVFEACQLRRPQDRPSLTGVTSVLLDELGGDEWWELPRNDLKFIERLGAGQFGEVNKMAARLLPDTKPGSFDSFVAVKTLKGAGNTLASANGYHGYELGDTSGGGDGAAAGDTTATVQDSNVDDQAEQVKLAAEHEKEFMAEVTVMKSLRHPNLVSLLGVCSTMKPLLMVLEYLPGGALDEWLPKNGAKAEPFVLLRLLHQAARGMAALGVAGVVHRDLAARNVLVDEFLRVKVADFGLSRDAYNDEGSDTEQNIYYRLRTDRPLPLRWTAPEVVLKLKHSSMSDVYAYGVLAFEIYSFGAFPFDPIADCGAFLKVLGADVGKAEEMVGVGAKQLPSMAVYLPLSAVKVLPTVVRSVIADCLLRDCAARPTFNDVVHRTRRQPVGVVAASGAGVGAGGAGGADGGGAAAPVAVRPRALSVCDGFGTATSLADGGDGAGAGDSLPMVARPLAVCDKYGTVTSLAAVYAGFEGGDEYEEGREEHDANA